MSESAFQYGGFQFDAFQIVSPLYVQPAFQPGAFQSDAFQSAEVPDEIITGGHAHVFGSSRKGRIRDEEWDKAVLESRNLELGNLLNKSENSINISQYLSKYSVLSKEAQSINNRTVLSEYHSELNSLKERNKLLIDLRNQNEEAMMMVILMCS